MRKIPYIVKKVQSQEGRPLTLSYAILVSGKDDEPERYGVEIVEQGSGESTKAIDLTMNAKRIYVLLDKLSEATVTPVGLMDVLADWLAVGGKAMDAEQLLRHLGISGQLKGFPFATYMVERIAEEPNAVFLITKCLYVETAKRFRVSSSVVERDVRVLVRACWERGDRAFLEEVAGTHISQRPTNSEFLDMLAAFLRRQARI